MTTPTHPRPEPVAAALCRTLERYPWRSFTPHLLARMALAQWDRHVVENLLAGVPGTSAGAWAEVEPAPADDPRAEALVAFLAAHRWADLTAGMVSRLLLGLLDDVPR